MSHCFIAFHQQDLELAQMVRMEIQKQGFLTWMDSEKFQARASWYMQIEQAIRESFAMVVLMTPSAQGCEWISYEWAFALGAGVRVVVLLFEPVELHPRLVLIDHFHFTNAHGYPWNDLFQKLQTIAQTRRVLRDESQRTQPQPSESPKKTEGAIVNDSDEKAKHAFPEVPSDQATVHEKLTESLNHPIREVRIQAALMLAQFKEVQAVPVLIEALHERDRDIQQHAAWGLMHIGLPASSALIQALQDEHSSVRKDVIRILGQIGDEQAIPPLINALQDESGEVCKHAAETLGILKAKAAVPALRTLLHDKREYIRRTAAESLGQIGDPAALPDLIHAFQDEHESVRIVAIWALGQIKDPSTVPVLIQAIRQENSQLRQVAAEVLKEIGDASSEPALHEALLDGNIEVRRVIARVIGSIRNRNRFVQ